MKTFLLSRAILTTALFCSVMTPGNTQVAVVNGAHMIVNPGTTMNSTTDLVFASGGSIDVQGTLILKEDLINQTGLASNLGTGTIVFSGSINQTISGQNIVQDLTLNNSTGLTVSGATRVNGILTLTSGLATLGSNNLVLGTGATVAGTPSATNMVVPTGSGELRKEFASAGSFTYPVGDATSTAEYSPVTLAFNSGTFGSGSYAGVSLADAQYAGTGTSYLTRYWNLSQSGITAFACNATFQYLSADVTGTESDIFSFRVNPAPFTAYNVANSGLHQLTVHGLSSLGTFTGNLGDGAVPPIIRSGQDKTVSTSGNCADAFQTMVIAGNGTYYIVDAAGSVNHIAGPNILYYPGTKVILGGHMHGYISTVFCSPYNHPAVPIQTTAGIEVPEKSVKIDNTFFRIYPNPTTGTFTVELNTDAPQSMLHIEIFGLLGDRILSKDMQIEHKQEFTLANKPEGVYMVHVSSGGNSETKKIIKH